MSKTREQTQIEKLNHSPLYESEGSDDTGDITAFQEKSRFALQDITEPELLTPETTGTASPRFIIPFCGQRFICEPVGMSNELVCQEK